MPKNNSKVMRQQRCDHAKADNADRDRLSPEAQIEQLDHRLGVGIGAKRERARLIRQLGS